MRQTPTQKLGKTPLTKGNGVQTAKPDTKASGLLAQFPAKRCAGPKGHLTKRSGQLSPSQRRAEIIQILTQAVRRLANSSPSSLETLGNGEESEESSLTSLDVSPESRLHCLCDNAL